MAFELDPSVNPWLRFLEDQPKTAFLGAAQPWLAGAGNTRANQRSIEDVFQQTLADFQTELGRRALSNENPDLLYSEFVGGLKPMDFTRRFARVTDAIPSTQRFNPRTRRLYFS
tara:strand:- start:225 stop:566 length:342 start_codon:yes stop_codon:yes gene_type:complete